MAKATRKSEQHNPPANGTTQVPNALLVGMSEAHLLRLFAIHFEKKHPNIPGKHFIAEFSGMSIRHVEKCMEGAAHLGIIAFHNLEFASGTNLLADWLQANNIVKYCATCPNKPSRQE